LADGAARAVRRDDVVGGHDPVAARRVAERDTDLVAAVLKADERRPQLDLRSRKRAEVVEQHALEMVLRHARGRGRADQRRLRAARQTELDRSASRICW
jgi:hypothetical protein